MDDAGNPEQGERERLERRRYEGQLRGQQLVDHDAIVASEIAAAAAPETFRAGEAIYKEGDRGDREGYILFLVLLGEVELRRRGRLLGIIKPGEHFGEFPLVDVHQQIGRASW